MLVMEGPGANRDDSSMIGRTHARFGEGVHASSFFSARVLHCVLRVVHDKTTHMNQLRGFCVWSLEASWHNPNKGWQWPWRGHLGPIPPGQCSVLCRVDNFFPVL